MTALEWIHAHMWIIPVMAVPLVILALRAVLRRRNRRRAEEEMTQMKRRDEALADALRNPLIRESRSRSEDAMEISWDEKAVTKPKGQAALMAELVELSGYSRRKYVFRTDQSISIGSAPENRLSLPREGVEKSHCEIFMTGQKPCVRSAAGAKTILRRGRKPVRVGQEGLYLRNGDHLQIGAADIQFRLFRA